MSELLVGIDLGTTMTKAAVVRTDGEEVSWGRVRTPWKPVATGSEADPAAFVGAAAQAAALALEGAPPGPVIGLGVTSMAETVILLGKDGTPVGPCIAWHDTRGKEEAADLRRAFPGLSFSERTGLRVSPVCTLVKLAWLSRHRAPAVHRALSVADWVVHALGGEQVAEASLASRTGALRLADRTWWPEALEWAGAPAGLFPPVVQAGEAVGRLTNGALGRLPGPAEGDWGALERLRGAALASAGHDHLCVAAGTAAIGPGQVLDSCGTAEALIRTVRPLGAAELGGVVSSGLSSGWHTVPGRYSLLSGHFLGLVLERVLSLLGVGGADGIAALDSAAEGVVPGSLRVVQEGPYADPSIMELGAGASPAALWSAALDAVCAGAPRSLQAMEAFAGPAEELVLSGGWAHCAGLRQRKRDLVPRVQWPDVVEAGARGAALFGGCAAGLFNGPADFPTPRARATVMPAPKPDRAAGNAPAG